MTGMIGGRLALVSAALLLALGTAACTDPAAEAKAEAEAKAKAETAQKRDRAQRQALHGIECINALKWQEAALSGAGIGPLSIYNEFFQAEIDAALAGGDIFAGEGARPMLSRATLGDYLKWSYGDAVNTKFTAGKDADGNGTVDGRERSAPGFTIVTSCVQEVAEMGKGPLAGKDKTARMFRIQEIRGKLRDKGA